MALGAAEQRGHLPSVEEVDERIGGIVWEEWVKPLSRHFSNSRRLPISIKTHRQLLEERKCSALLGWVSALSSSCDALCGQTCGAIDKNAHLVPLLRSDLRMGRDGIAGRWHGLLLTLLATPAFKSALAEAYTETYGQVTDEYARGVGISEYSSYTLSVQFLNRQTYVKDLVRKGSLLHTLSASLLHTLSIAAVPVPQKETVANSDDGGNEHPAEQEEEHPPITSTSFPSSSSTPVSSPTDADLSHRQPLDLSHPVMTNRRYSPVISDLKCVLNVVGIARVYSSKCLDPWLAVLRRAQEMDPQKWIGLKGIHVIEEPKGWIFAFNAGISLSSLFEKILAWEDNDDSSPIDPSQLFRMDEVTWRTLLGVHAWFRSVQHRYSPVLRPPPRRKIRFPPSTRAAEAKRAEPSRTLPLSTVAADHGTLVAMPALPLGQSAAFSFHLLLHHFFVACLRELLRREDAVIPQLLARIAGTTADGPENWGGGELAHLCRSIPTVFIGLMEFPVLALSRAAQIRAGLWKRNGHCMYDQCMNYAEPPFCKMFRDADLFLVQFAALGYSHGESSAAYLINLLLHRFGIFSWIGLTCAPDVYTQEYLNGIESNLFPSVDHDNTVNNEKSNSDKNDDADGKNDDTDGDENTHCETWVPDDDVCKDMPGIQLPSSHSPARDTHEHTRLLEEFLHLVIIFITELPVPSHPSHITARLRREVLHRLTSGPCTHSELAEVHHVLSQSENVTLQRNTSPPTLNGGGTLESILKVVAERRPSKGLEPDRFQLLPHLWEEYDPAFWHVTTRSHQVASDARPKYPGKARSWAPQPPVAHPSFCRLRKDVTADASWLAVVFRTVHVHCAQDLGESFFRSDAYSKDAWSETALARAVHLLTLGWYAWSDEDADRDNGGGTGPGSVFSDPKGPANACPSLQDWIETVFLSLPSKIMSNDNSLYQYQECLLLLLNRLAQEGGAKGFAVQDVALRSGALFLVQSVARVSEKAKFLLSPPFDDTATESPAAQKSDTGKRAGDFARRRKEAMERAMRDSNRRIKAFADLIRDFSDEDDGEDDLSERDAKIVPVAADTSMAVVGRRPQDLLQNRPRCFICNEDDAFPAANTSSPMCPDATSNPGPKAGNVVAPHGALALVCHLQASSVLHPVNSSAHVGAHVSLCGHAVHSVCFDTYFASVVQRGPAASGGDRNASLEVSRGEFNCPMCKRLSNGLLPYVDAYSGWLDCEEEKMPAAQNDIPQQNGDLNHDQGVLSNCLESFRKPSLPEIPNTDISSDIQFCVDSQDGQEHFGSSASPENPLSGTDKYRMLPYSAGRDSLVSSWETSMRNPLIPQNSFPAVTSLDTTPRPAENSGRNGDGCSVWMLFMNRLCEVVGRANEKRLEDEVEDTPDAPVVAHLHDQRQYQEFRHYASELAAYTAHRALGNTGASGIVVATDQSLEWPNCVSNQWISQEMQDMFAGEQLFSKLLESVQSFTYSCCAEAANIRRIYSTYLSTTNSTDSTAESSQNICGGVQQFRAGGKLIVMKQSSTADKELFCFEGCLGKLRYYGLCLAAAAAPCSDLMVQMVFFPECAAMARNCQESSPKVSKDGMLPPEGITMNKPQRAPIVYPILFGHVLSLTTAAMTASSGRRREYLIKNKCRQNCQAGVREHAFQDHINVIQLGFMARVLQVLFEKMDWESQLEQPDRRRRANVIHMVDEVISSNNIPDNGWDSDGWFFNCCHLVRRALENCEDVTEDEFVFDEKEIDEIKTQFREDCACACLEGEIFLSDIAVILQILEPGFRSDFAAHQVPDHEKSTLEIISNWLGIHTFSTAFSSKNIFDVIQSWYLDALNASNKKKMGSLEKLLSCPISFRPNAWSTQDLNKHSLHEDSNYTPCKKVDVSDMDSPNRFPAKSPISIPSPNIAPKGTVPLIGYTTNCSLKLDLKDTPHLLELPTSYTDFYAELSRLSPHTEQTSLCLVCGKVLNAGGKGECTNHAVKCGAGSGLFFLLQDCVGLIIHDSKAAYVHSPYVDSHGETPQFRGRPLNLDLDRYRILEEMWHSHQIKQKVITERANARQVIISNYY
uniref:E3 ubiquitin-protein ligase n=1 Tax=Corethron hystrix TaxID=216773 RepID=A0A7S1FYU0_9STRA